MIGAHQPTFLPWAGYWYKNLICSEWVDLHLVEFSKNDYVHRVTLDGHWLTVPVHYRSNMSITDVCVTGRLDKLCKTIEQSCMSKRNPFGKRLEPVVAYLAAVPPGTPLWVANVAVRDMLRQILLADRTWVLQKTRLQSTVTVGGTTSSRLASYLAGCRSTAYLSGYSGREYLNADFPYEIYLQSCPGAGASKDSIVQLIAREEDPLMTIQGWFDHARWIPRT